MCARCWRQNLEGLEKADNISPAVNRLQNRRVVSQFACSHRYGTVPDELGVRGRGMKFGIGQPMRRHEDLRLITGRGCYTDDVILPRMTHAFVLRSPVAHAHIKRIDAAAARRMPGVLFVATGEDVRADGLGNVPCMVPLVNRDGSPRHDTPRPVLALGKVRHVGQPVALVVAETLTAARDAAEAIDVEYEPLPAITEAKDAISPGAPQLFDHIRCAPIAALG